MGTKHIDPEDKEVQLRKCLGPDCGIIFLSLWVGNRLCSSCTQKIKAITGNTNMDEDHFIDGTDLS